MALYSVVAPKAEKARKCQIIALIYWKCVCDMIFDIITSLILAVNKTRIGWLGSDWTADRIGLWIRSNWTDIFSFGAEELFWEKLFLIMTQMALNKKSEFSQQESNLCLVQTHLRVTRLKQIGVRRLVVNENNVNDIWRGHSLVDNKSSLSYLTHSHYFLNHLLWEILTSPSAIFDCQVTKPLFGIVIVWSYATENFPVQFSWK